MVLPPAWRPLGHGSAWLGFPEGLPRVNPSPPQLQGEVGSATPKEAGWGGGQVPVADNTLRAGPHSLCTLEGC